MNIPFPNKPWFLRICSTNLLKTLREKEKLLVTSNFSFSHSVFYPFEKLSSILIKFDVVVFKLFQFGRVQNSSFGRRCRLLAVSPFSVVFKIPLLQSRNKHGIVLQRVIVRFYNTSVIFRGSAFAHGSC